MPQHNGVWGKGSLVFNQQAYWQKALCGHVILHGACTPAPEIKQDNMKRKSGQRQMGIIYQGSPIPRSRQELNTVLEID